MEAREGPGRHEGVRNGRLKPSHAHESAHINVIC